MSTDALDQLRESGCDVGLLWRRIKDAIGRTIISACGFLLQAEAEKRPSVRSLCCFQVIGCDVLLNRDLRPYVLEINDRPSLKSRTREDGDLQLRMLNDGLKFGCSYAPI
jgi:hypothetical protein